MTETSKHDDNPGERDRGGVESDSPRPIDPAADLAHQIINEEQDRALVERVQRVLGGDTPGCAAERLGLPYYTVCRVVAGRRPTIEVLRRVCSIYRVDGHWLLTGEGPPLPEDRAAATVRAAASDVLLMEVSRRLTAAHASRGSSKVDAVARRAQAALDELRGELDQVP